MFIDEPADAPIALSDASLRARVDFTSPSTANTLTNRGVHMVTPLHFNGTPVDNRYIPGQGENSNLAHIIAL